MSGFYLLSLPEADISYRFHVKHSWAFVPELLAVAGGRKPCNSWLKEAALGRRVYCADRGAEYCVESGVKVDFLFGDKDSADPKLYDRLKGAGTEVSVYPAAKDATDLQLLLESLPDGPVVATGVFGGRFDHLFSCVYSLLKCKGGRGCLALADEKELLVLLEAGEEARVTVKEKAPFAVSLLPLSPSCVVTLKGARWPLEEARLEQLSPYAISNELVIGGRSVDCMVKDGALGLYLAWES